MIKKMFKNMTASLLTASSLLALTPAAKAADVDYRPAITSVAATVTLTFTNDLSATDSAFLLDSVLVGSTTSTSTTYAVNHVIGTVTNLTIGKTGTASRVITTTSFPPFFIGDKLVITSSDTNTFVYRLNARRR